MRFLHPANQGAFYNHFLRDLRGGQGMSRPWAHFSKDSRRREGGCPQEGESRRPEMVGVAGFEPATPSSRTRCATRLRHTPMMDTSRYSHHTIRSQDAHGAKAGQNRTQALPRAAMSAISRLEPGRGKSTSSFLGRSQAVRQRVLIPSCAGSNPAAPAMCLAILTHSTSASPGPVIARVMQRL